MGRKIFSVLFSSFYFFKVKGVRAQNIQTSHQGDLRKTRHPFKLHPLIHSADTRQIVVKIKKSI